MSISSPSSSSLVSILSTSMTSFISLVAVEWSGLTTFPLLRLFIRASSFRTLYQWRVHWYKFVCSSMPFQLQIKCRNYPWNLPQANRVNIWDNFCQFLCQCPLVTGFSKSIWHWFPFLDTKLVFSKHCRRRSIFGNKIFFLYLLDIWLLWKSICCSNIFFPQKEGCLCVCSVIGWQEWIWYHSIWFCIVIIYQIVI